MSKDKCYIIRFKDGEVARVRASKPPDKKTIEALENIRRAINEGRVKV